MASGMVNLRLNDLVDFATGKNAAPTAFTLPPLLRLMTVTGSATAAGTELGTSGGYTAGGLTMGSSAFPSSAYSGGQSSSNNANVVTWTNMPAATIVGVEIWDSAATKLRWWYGDLTASKTTNSGDTLSFAANSVTVAIQG
jgi:hypothetical protein